MTLNIWVQILLAVVASLAAVGQLVFWVGRWTKGAEDTSALAIEKLSWEVKRLSEVVERLRIDLGSQHTELANRVNADHVLVREMLTWRAGLMTELIAHFYPMTMIDRFMSESRERSDNISARLDLVEQRSDRRATTEWDGKQDRRGV